MKREYYLKHRKNILKQKRDYYLQNKDTIISKKREYRKLNKYKIKERDKERRTKKKWYFVYYNLLARCNNKNSSSYKDYGGRGIQALISLEEVKELWFRDKAYKMKQPSINRIDNDGNYTFANCEFIEKGKNSAERNTRISSKPIFQFDLQGIFIKEWNSIRLAAECYKVSSTAICTALKNKSISCNSKWEYKNENINK